MSVVARIHTYIKYRIVMNPYCSHTENYIESIA